MIFVHFIIILILTSSSLEYRMLELADLEDLDLFQPSVTDRYYSKHYSCDMSTPYNDHLIARHSNKLCLVMIAPSHPIKQKKVGSNSKKQ